MTGRVGVNGSSIGWLVRHRGWADLQLPDQDQQGPHIQHRAGPGHQRICSREDGCHHEGADSGTRRRSQGLPGVNRLTDP